MKRLMLLGALALTGCGASVTEESLTQAKSRADLCVPVLVQVSGHHCRITFTPSQPESWCAQYSTWQVGANGRLDYINESGDVLPGPLALSVDVHSTDDNTPTSVALSASNLGGIDEAAVRIDHTGACAISR